MENKVKVIIDDMRRIPTIGKGPIRQPIYIDQDVYDLLKLLGFNVIIVEETKIQKISEGDIIEEEIITEEELEEEIITEEVVEELEEEIITEEVVEELEEEIITEEVVVEEVLDVESMTKKELKEELDAREIKYAHNATLDALKELLKKAL